MCNIWRKGNLLMTTKIAINGFGRIGRMVFRKAIHDPEVEIVAINASYPVETLAHLIKYDTIHGNLADKVETDGNTIIVNGKKTILVSDRNPANLPWKDLGIEIVIEATGKFKDHEGASKHIEAGAKKVVITAPGKNEDVTIVMGVNEDAYDYYNHQIISNASCTTNCLAPVAKVLDEKFGIKYGMMTTIHAYTNDQKNLDNPHKDLRRARACAQSIIPTSTGAARAVAKVLPQLQGKLNGFALRIPTPNVSVVDLVVELNTSVTAEEVNQVFREASESSLKGILGYTDEPLVSSDFNGSEVSTVVDGLSTMVMGDTQLKVLAWHDNEWGYSCRVLDLAKFVSEASFTKKKVEVNV